MCLATLTINGAILDESAIRNAWNSNPDGGGIAYFDPNTGKLQAFRTLSLPKMIRGYNRLIDAGAHAMPMAIHFRYATHGDSTIANVHPFPMDANTLVIHNGMLPIESVGNRSDTNIFVRDVLPKLGPTWMDDPHMFDLVQGYCQNGYANKLVILTDHPEAKFRAYVINPNAGAWNDAKNIWHSNGSWQAPKPRIATYSDWWQTPNEKWGACESDDDAGEFRACDLCGEWAVTHVDESRALACLICGSCATCAMEWDECTCTNAIRFHEMTDSQASLFAM